MAIALAIVVIVLTFLLLASGFAIIFVYLPRWMMHRYELTAKSKDNWLFRCGWSACFCCIHLHRFGDTYGDGYRRLVSMADRNDLDGSGWSRCSRFPFGNNRKFWARDSEQRWFVCLAGSAGGTDSEQECLAPVILSAPLLRAKDLCNFEPNNAPGVLPTRDQLLLAVSYTVILSE